MLTPETLDCDEREIVDHSYKILVIGDFACGKTSIIRRFTEGYYSPNYKMTIGVDFALKTVYWDEFTKINMQLWDVAGNERFTAMTRVYYKYAMAAIIVFDLTRPGTFESVSKWLNDLNSKVVLEDDHPVPCLLMANKCDAEDAVIDPVTLDSFCKKNNIIAWLPTSAKDDINIDNGMRFLVDYILTMERGIDRPSSPINLSQSFVDFYPTEGKSSCCKTS